MSINILGNCNIEGEDDDWDFGTGAGFYVNATEEKWKKHYRMYSYVTKEVSLESVEINKPKKFYAVGFYNVKKCNVNIFCH